MDHGEISLLVLFDLSKCFDVVSYSNLIKIAETEGRLDCLVFKLTTFQITINTSVCVLPMNINAYPERSETRLACIRVPRSDPSCTTSSQTISAYTSTVNRDVTSRNTPMIRRLLLPDTNVISRTSFRLQRMESVLCTLFQWFAQNQM